jgi:hypothetical protein
MEQELKRQAVKMTIGSPEKVQNEISQKMEIE